MNKTLIWVVIILVVIGGVWALSSKETATSGEEIKVGVIIPLSGPAAVWGESLKEGMDMAVTDLAAEGVDIELLYEDSQTLPALGVSAYQKLTDIDGADVIFTAFSRVSVPLIPLAEEDGIPLVMTLVSAQEVTESPNVFRLFSTSEDYVRPVFSAIRSAGSERLAILYVNDEYGVSTRDAVRRHSTAQQKEIVAEESFEAGVTDFCTQLTKIKALNPDALVFIGAFPQEVISGVKQSRELLAGVDFIEASLLLSLDFIREGIGAGVEGAITNAYTFSLGLEGNDFKEKYEGVYGKSPLFGSALGYDMVRLVSEAAKQKGFSKDDILASFTKVKGFDGAMGELENIEGEINPDLRPVKIENNQLVEIK